MPSDRSFPSSPSVRRDSDRRPRRGGFTFIEILVVMGVIAVLVGLSIGMYGSVAKRAAELETRAVVQKMRVDIDAWRAAYKMTVPSDLQRLKQAGVPAAIGATIPPNTTNSGIEAAVQCVTMLGFDHNADIDGDLMNSDEDRLDRPLARSGVPDLFETRDKWGNPLIYIPDADYAAAEKNPPSVLNGADSRANPGEMVHPRPWRNASGAFAQAGGYQLYSMGPDGKPNTDDDITAWAK
jgi:prepilin-type N-terminal cleavage/methylation domain-containing protein